jgi:hypothetical protein
MNATPNQLHAGAEVISADDHKLGSLTRVVLRRSDLSITHVVVDIGILRSGHHLWQGAFSDDYDRVVPIAAVSEAGEKQVRLSLTADQFRDQPQYTHETFEPTQELTPGEFDMTDVVERGDSIAAIGGNANDFWIHARRTRELDEVDIAEGMGVWREEPHEKLGEVDRALFDANGALEALVMKKGFLLTREIVMPARYISEIVDDVSIRVDISDAEIKQLEHFDAKKRTA